MRSINWLNIREMVEYYTLIMTWKTLKLKSPQHLAGKIVQNQDLTISTTNLIPQTI